MKALSITRPWPTLILRWGKDVENRTWPTRRRGRLGIHAALSWDPDAVAWAERHGLIPPGAVSADPADHPTGLVGVVDLVDVVRDNPSRWAMPGLWHWSLRDPHPLPAPRPCRGRLGLWQVPDDVAAAINSGPGAHQRLDVAGPSMPTPRSAWSACPPATTATSPGRSRMRPWRNTSTSTDGVN